MVCIVWSTCSSRFRVAGSSPAALWMRTTSGLKTSQAPLTAKKTSSPTRQTPPARLLSTSKAKFLTRFLPSAMTSSFNFSPNSLAMATSSGSPEKPFSPGRISDAQRAGCRIKPDFSTGSSPPLRGSASRVIVSRFRVRVPVLSVQMTCTAPRASTAVNPLTSTFFRAMRKLAIARERVKVGSRPSGTLATIMPIMNTRFTQRGRPVSTPYIKKETPIRVAITVSTRTI